MKNRDQVTYRDQTLPIIDWAHRQTTMPAAAFLSRLAAGWTMGQLLGDEPPPPPPQRRFRGPALIEYQGFKLTPEEWATRAGIPLTTFVNRRGKGWSMAQILGEEPRPARKRNGRLPLMIEHNGLKLTAEQWAQRAGMPKATFVTRRANDWTMAQILGEEPRPQGKRQGRRPKVQPSLESVPLDVANTPEGLALARVRRNLEAARRELVAAGSAQIGQAIARRVRALIREDIRLSESIASSRHRRP
jgi:hypothetical protein